ncbi:unnamed protein product, partial [Iphiclides podalirius]
MSVSTRGSEHVTTCFDLLHFDRLFGGGGAMASSSPEDEEALLCDELKELHSPSGAATDTLSSLGSICDSARKDSDLEKGRVEETDVLKGKWCTIKEYLKDYTVNSNLHGLRYIGDKERTTVEKLFWLFMFICCLVFCARSINSAYTKWNESPLIVSFSENPTPVWEIPYPAVTVCLETKSMQTRFNFTKYFHLYTNNITYVKLTEEERHMYEDISLVCDDHLAPLSGRKFSNGNTTVANLKRVSPNAADIFFGCKWKDVPVYNCVDLFSPILTEVGSCYTFNTMGAEEILRIENLHTEYKYLETSNSSRGWTLEEGYPPFTPVQTYPYRGSGYGAKGVLIFLLKTNDVDLDNLCKGPVQGFKV